MDNDQQLQKKFLEEQMKWCKKQDDILEEIEEKLYEMKELAVYSLNNELKTLEIEKLNNKFNTLKRKVYFLEQQLQTVVH